MPSDNYMPCGQDKPIFREQGEFVSDMYIGLSSSQKTRKRERK